MSSAADDIADFLEDDGVGTVAGAGQWGIYVGKEPVKPDDCITVYDTGGNPDNADGPFYQPTVQIRVRSTSYALGYAKASEARDKMIIPKSRQGVEWEYTGFWLISDVAKIGTDDSDRELFTVNLRLMREPLVISS